MNSIKITKGPVSLIQGDLTEMDTDAIVNPSNTGLILGAGVSGAINSKAGSLVQEQMSKIGGCEVGRAVVTGSGNLKAKYIIHAVGPKMGEGDEDSKLRSATMESIKRAEELNLKSIAFPAVSTGIFGFPLGRCATVMLSAVLDHYARGDNKSLEKIVFCLWEERALNIFAQTLEWLTPEGVN